MKIFKDIEDFYTWAVTNMPAYLADAEGWLAKAEAELGTPLATAIAKLFGAKGTQIQADLNTLCGALITACATGALAIADGGTNVTLDAAAASALKSLVGAVKDTVGTIVAVPANATVVTVSST